MKTRIPFLVLSLGMLASFAMLTTEIHGQPQGENKAKKA